MMPVKHLALCLDMASVQLPCYHLLLPSNIKMIDHKMLSNTQRQVNFNHLDLSKINQKAGSRIVKSSNNSVVSPKRWEIAGLVLTYEEE